MPSKPKKPRPDFPLFAHANGSWAKKICGDLYDFGPWADPQKALAKYLADKEDLQAGRAPIGKRGKSRSIRVSCGSNCVIARPVLVVVRPQELERRSWCEVASTVEATSFAPQMRDILPLLERSENA